MPSKPKGARLALAPPEAGLGAGVLAADEGGMRIAGAEAEALSVRGLRLCPRPWIGHASSGHAASYCRRSCPYSAKVSVVPSHRRYMGERGCEVGFTHMAQNRSKPWETTYARIL